MNRYCRNCAPNTWLRFAPGVLAFAACALLFGPLHSLSSHSARNDVDARELIDRLLAVDANSKTQEESLPAASRGKKKPLNVVLLYADDWSFNTLGARGNDYVKTPVLDEMAREGVLFTHGCVVTSICMQSRATLYTGQYSSRHRTYYAYRGPFTMYETGRWNETLYPLMKGAGYHVGFYGKWHHPDPPGEPFTHSRLYQGSHYIERDGVDRHVTELNEHDALEFLEDRPRDKPFFLTVSFFATHAEDGGQTQYRPMNSSSTLYRDEPVPVPKTMTDRHWRDMPHFFTESNFGRSRYKKRYRTPELYQHHMKNTLRMATEVDAACGSVLRKLREQGVLNETLVMFTTDNGNMHGQHGLAEKWYPYEESIRVPLIVRDPRAPPPAERNSSGGGDGGSGGGRTNSEFVLNIDLAPTILSAAGIVPPDVMQGRDFAPLYLEHAERSAQSWRKEFLYEYRDDATEILNSLALVKKDSKFIFWEENDYEQFFDLKNDPYEEFDLWNRTVESLLQEMRSRLQKYSKLVGHASSV